MPYLIAFAALLGLLRVFGVTGQAFQAIAHIFVAVLYTASYYDKSKRKQFLYIATALTILEVVAAVAFQLVK